MVLGFPQQQYKKVTAMTATLPEATTTTAQWKKKAAGDLIELPSGNVIRMRRVGLQTIMATGMMPNSLLSITQKAVNKGTGHEGPSEADIQAMATDPAQFAEMMKFFDSMVCFVTAEPQIHPLPAAGVERSAELLYIDEVDDDDKMFIFQVVTGGTTSIEQFRQEHASYVDVVRGSEDVELPTE